MSSKTISSKSIDHIRNYSLYQQVSAYLLSFSLVAALTTYAIAISNFAYTNIISKLTPLVGLLKFFDAKFDALVLSNVDYTVATGLSLKGKAEASLNEYKTKGGDVISAYKKKGEDTIAAYKKQGGDIVSAYKKQGGDIVATYKKKGEDVVATYKKKGEDVVEPYLKPVNEYASNTVDKVLPKVKDSAAKAEKSAKNEIGKLIDIVNDTYERSKDLIVSKKDDLTKTVTSTYNKEFDAAPEKNYYIKVASASVSTGITLLRNVNSEYIQPLKTQTQSYVTDVAAQTKSKALEVVAKGQEAVEKNTPTLNGSLQQQLVPVVSALA